MNRYAQALGNLCAELKDDLFSPYVYTKQYMADIEALADLVNRATFEKVPYDENEKMYFCPECGLYFNDLGVICYCPQCGQALDFEEGGDS